MYNLHQFTNIMQQHEREVKKENQQQQYHLKHQQYKKYAYNNLKKKADQFLKRQLSCDNPTIIQDDHFQSWRKHRIFRDVEQQNKFKGNKVFKHRPNEDMNKHYNQRERRQRAYLQSKKQELVKSGVIPKQHISRSLASQGPYQPKIQFRQIKKDDQYLQPRLRYTNITDEQKLNESEMQFDERLQSIYQKFKQKKLKVGKSVKSTYYGIPGESSYTLSQSKMTAKSVSLQRVSRSVIEQPETEQLSAVASSQIFGQTRKKAKTYFKLAQMMEMFHPEVSKREEMGELLKKSQFSRKKDLTNIRSNSFNENYNKHPIL